MKRRRRKRMAKKKKKPLHRKYRSSASEIVGAQWQLAANPVVITLAGVISELTAVKCQSSREESARVING